MCLQTEKDGFQFEYTTSGTLQQNGRVERKFSTLLNTMHGMLNGGKFSSFLRNSIWAKAANTVTLLENNILTPMRDLSLY